MSQRFAETSALVTGAGSGIGRAIALALAAEGAAVCLAGRRGELLGQVAGEAGEGAFGLPTDLTSAQEVERLVHGTRQRLGKLDILVHSAGGFALGSVETTPVEELDRLYAVNLRAPYLLTRELLPDLRVSHGQIVFVNSSAGLAPRGQLSAYAATKAAFKALADSLRDEENGNGIRVLSVYPGRTASPMQEEAMRIVGRRYHPGRLLQPEDIAQTVLDALALPRTAELTDLQIRPMLKS